MQNKTDFTILLLGVIIAILLMATGCKTTVIQCHFEKGECCNELCPEGNGNKDKEDTQITFTPLTNKI